MTSFQLVDGIHYPHPSLLLSFSLAPLYMGLYRWRVLQEVMDRVASFTKIRSGTDHHVDRPWNRDSAVQCLADRCTTSSIVTAMTIYSLYIYDR